MGGLGNNILQVLATIDAGKPSYSSLLQSKNLVTGFLGWAIHDNVIWELFDPPEYSSSPYYLAELMDVFLLMLSKKTNRRILSKKFLLGNVEHALDDLSSVCGYTHPLTADQYEFLAKKKCHLRLNLQLVERIAVHVRRGDLGDNQSLGLLQAEAINQAVINEIDRHSLPVVVFTNDSQWCSENLSFEYQFAEQNLGKSPVVNDFYGLACSSILICANSTFSYTAAMLGCNKRVVAPSPFFRYEPIYLPNQWATFDAIFE